MEKPGGPSALRLEARRMSLPIACRALYIVSANQRRMHLDLSVLTTGARRHFSRARCGRLPGHQPTKRSSGGCHGTASDDSRLPLHAQGPHGLSFSKWLTFGSKVVKIGNCTWSGHGSTPPVEFMLAPALWTGLASLLGRGDSQRELESGSLLVSKGRNMCAVSKSPFGVSIRPDCAGPMLRHFAYCERVAMWQRPPQSRPPRHKWRKNHAYRERKNHAH